MRGNRSRVIEQPPQLSTNVKITHWYRFRSTDGAATGITQNDLRGIAGAVCTVANSAVSLIAISTKVHEIRIWSPPASQGAVSTNAIQWNNVDFTAGPEVSDTTMSTAIPARIRARPPKGSAASFLLGSGTDNILVITAPAGSIIDVHCTHVLYDAQVAGTALTVAAGTLGALYYMPLDGVSDVYLPVSLGTTT